MIRIKTVDKKLYNIEGNFTNVLDLSLALEAQHGFSSGLQQLIFAGKILGVEEAIPVVPEEGFLVLMMLKPKKVNQPVPKPIPTEATSEATPEATTDTKSGLVLEAAPEDRISVVTAPSYELVRSLMELGGYPEEDVRHALNITGNNADAAAAVLEDPSVRIQLDDASAEGTPMNLLGGTTPETLTEEQVVQMLEANPDAFNSLIQAVIQQQPQIAEIMQRDPLAFLGILTQILNQVAGGDAARGENGALVRLNPNLAAAGNDQGSRMPPTGAVQIQVTEEEKLALEGLQAMFPHVPPITILQTFKACGSDAGLAANLLFDVDSDAGALSA